MRAVFTMHGEPLTVVARADSGIEDISDFPGKRVNIGNLVQAAQYHGRGHGCVRLG